jgi:hypothetical protein
MVSFNFGTGILIAGILLIIISIGLFSLNEKSNMDFIPAYISLGLGIFGMVYGGYHVYDKWPESAVIVDAAGF